MIAYWFEFYLYLRENYTLSEMNWNSHELFNIL